MSQCPVAEPADEAACPSASAGRALYVVPERPPLMTHEESEKSLGRLRDRARRDAAIAARYGMLGRYDEPEDPDRGVGLFEALVFQETSRLNDSGWLDRQEAIARLEARLAALKAEAIAGFDAALHGVSADLGHEYPEPGDRAATAGERRWVAGDLRSVADEVALVLQMHKGPAMARIHTSCELVHNFPATLHALAEGDLTERAAFTIVRELSVLEDLVDIRAAEAAVLEWARKHPLQKIKKEAQRQAALRDPAARSKAHARAMDERSVRIFPTSDGTAELIHTQDALDAAAVMTSLSRAAAYRRRHGDPRTLDQLRADIALSRLLPRTKRAATSGGTTDATPGGAGSRGDGGPRNTGGVDSDPPATRWPDTDLVDDDLVDDDSAGRRTVGDWFGDVAGSAGDVVDEAAIGADATVVIHATGAELRALINAQPGTGGEADHHGPIPQNSLRKHLIRALARTLLPNLSTGAIRDPRPETGEDGDADPGTGPRPGKGPRHPGPHTGTGAGIDPRGSADPSPDPSPDAPTGPDLSGAPAEPKTASTDKRTAVALGRGRARIDIRITDEPPCGNPDKYTPTAAVDRYVRLRDRTCQFPGCNRPAEFTDLDHRTAFVEGGRTTTHNLHCLCRHHHRLKHHGDWTITPNPDGMTTWTSPTGRRYRTPPTEPGLEHQAIERGQPQRRTASSA
jgi:hypothetical protein